MLRSIEVRFAEDRASQERTRFEFSLQARGLRVGDHHQVHVVEHQRKQGRGASLLDLWSHGDLSKTQLSPLPNPERWRDLQHRRSRVQEFEGYMRADGKLGDLDV